MGENDRTALAHSAARPSGWSTGCFAPAQPLGVAAAPCAVPGYGRDMGAHPELGEAVSDWIVRQRWFAGKGGVPRLRLLASLEWSADDACRVVTHFVLDEGGQRGVLYQVPIVYRATAPDSLAASHIGSTTDPSGSRVHAYDGPHDPAFTELLLRLVLDEGRIEGEPVSARGVRVHRRDGAPDEHRMSRMLDSRVLAGEQSNTSIVYLVADDVGERQLICKVFRSLHHGENPDVVLQSALYAAGSASVPAVVGSVVGEWPDTGRASGRAQGHLAFAQEFLAGAMDAWQLALDAAASGTDFTASARQMGSAIAEVHTVLASAFPTKEPSRDDLAVFAALWQERLEAAIGEVPELQALRRSIEATYARAVAASWPRLQRIHGDLHLGQILAVPGDRWAIIDFEGEPMRTLETRSVPDAPLRDVAGMMRSFDYVAGANESTPGVRDWTSNCRSAFLDGYSERSGHDLRRDAALLDAFELDKALYEAVYEARNRPTWLPIPVAAIRRLA